MNINRICLNLLQMSSKNYAIFFWGGEVIKKKITLDHRGEGGRSRQAKKVSHNFLTLP